MAVLQEIDLKTLVSEKILNDWKEDDVCYIQDIIKRSLEVKPKYEIVEYIERTRILNERVSAIPGYYSFKVTPYLREIIRNFDEDSPIQYVDFMKGAQIGATVGLDENLIMYLLGNSPAPILFLASTSEVAEQIFTLRVSPSIEESGLGHLFKSAIKNKKSRETGNTKSYKTFDGGFIQLGGLQTISKLKSFSIKVLIITEADEAKIDVGGQGNAITLAERRTDAYSNIRKILIESTPKMATGESFIEQRFLEGDRRFYHVPCKDCGELQILDFDNLKYELDNEGFLIPSSVHYECKFCGSHWKEVDKKDFLKTAEDGGHARWIPTSKSADPKRRSYHLSSLYAPIGFRSWESIIRDYLKAAEAEKNGDDSFIKVFYNTVLGQTYKAIEDVPPYDYIYNKNRGNYLKETIDEYGKIKQSTLNIDELKYKPLFCNIAVDIQKRYIECGVFLWTEGYRSYMLGYHRLDGDTSNLQSRCWLLLEKIIKSSHLGFYASIVFIDKGFIPAVVTDFCQGMYQKTKKYGDVVFAIKGEDTGKFYRFQDDNKSQNPPALILNSSMAKDEVYNALSIEKSEKTEENAEELPIRWAYFPDDTDMNFFRMLTAEEKVAKHTRSSSNKYEWRLRAGQRRNEALDIFAYSTAAAFFYVSSISPKDKNSNINYKAVWDYLKSENGIALEKMNKFE